MGGVSCVFETGRKNAKTRVLEQLSPDILKTSDAEALRKFHEVVQRWTAIAAAELARREEER
jgi:hypothetical protein